MPQSDLPRLPVPSLGAAYYPEYLLHDRIDDDLTLMSAAGIRTIRVGESVWSTWEPADGEFDTAWITPLLDAAERHGIAVMLGTPTYAVPPWLMLTHPEIAGESATGRRIPWGARQEADVHHPVFRRYAERLIRRILADHAQHPAIAGFQVDNEPGEHLLHNAEVFAGFREHLAEEYGVEHLNDRWNLAHWSHRIRDLDELWLPDGNHVPQYDLAWRRYQAAITAEYIAWQTAIVREYASPEQYVTTCVDRDRAGVDERALGRAVDVAGANLYVATQEAAGPDASASPRFPASGDWAAFYGADRARAIAGGPFLVTETNATSVGSPWHSFPPLDGQWRLFAWAFVARGARLVSYWNWHTMHASWETQWHGVLPHTFTPGRTYREIAALGAELRAAEPWTASLTPDARVGLLFSSDAKWLWNFQPPVALPQQGTAVQGDPDRHAYEEVAYRWYGGLSRAGLGLRMLHAADLGAADAARLAAELPVLAVPALPVAGDTLVEALAAYVGAGGHLVLGARSLTCDDDGRYRDHEALAEFVQGAFSVGEYTSLRGAIPVSGEASGVSGQAQGLLELLDLAATGPAEVVAQAQSVFGETAAIVSTTVGSGRVTYVATLPSVDLVTSLGAWLGERTPSCSDAWPGERPPGVHVQSAQDAEGGAIWFVFNVTGERMRVELGADFRDRLTDAETTVLQLRPWDVAVLEARS